MMTTAERRVLETKAIFETVTALPQTGSKAYGLPNPKDDDRYCDPKTFKDLKDTLDKAEIPYSRKSSREGGDPTRVERNCF